MGHACIESLISLLTLSWFLFWDPDGGSEGAFTIMHGLWVTGWVASGMCGAKIKVHHARTSERHR